MPIPDEDIEVFEKAAAAEVATGGLPFLDHIDAIERFFAKAEAEPGSHFKLFPCPDDDSPYPDWKTYRTSIGIFDLTPRRGVLYVPQEDGKPLEVEFFSKRKDTDRTTSLASATIRCTRRYLYDTKIRPTATPPIFG